MMSTVVLVLVGWFVISVPLALLVASFIRFGSGEANVPLLHATELNSDVARAPGERRASTERLRILAVDDDPHLRALLQATFDVTDVELREAHDAPAAEAQVMKFRPHVLILDVGLPGLSGFDLCRKLKADPETRDTPIVLLTGSESIGAEDALASGADGFVRKPFSPLALLDCVRRLAGRPSVHDSPTLARELAAGTGDQLMLYARDLRTLLDVENGQRVLLQKAYADTVLALARALESKDFGTGAHAQRVTRYAVELARAYEPALLNDPGVEYGFLLHDVGKIGIPDAVLRKRGPLAPAEQRLLETHTVLGEQMLGEVDLLRGESLGIVRHHHERWDGAGYPDALAGPEIPLGARVFAIADTLDAMTSDRPYRRALSWSTASQEIFDKAGTQFSPAVVEAFSECEPRLLQIHHEFRRTSLDDGADVSLKAS